MHDRTRQRKSKTKALAMRSAVVAAVCGVLLVAQRGPAEDVPPPPEPHGSLPVVPQRTPRSNDGQFQPNRDDKPLPSFVETLRGNDAAIRVPLGQGRLITTKYPISSDKGTRFIAIGDPSIADFEVLPNSRMIRVTGKRAGVTDLSVTTADDQTYSFEVQVVYELDMLRAQLRQSFPDTEIRLGQLRDCIIVEGQVRNTEQVVKVMLAITTYLDALQPTQDTHLSVGTQQNSVSTSGSGSSFGGGYGAGNTGNNTNASSTTQVNHNRIINLLQVPGVNQVMLQVRIAELNRTALREIGADLLAVDPHTGTIVGTQLSGSTISALGTLGLGGLTGAATAAPGANTTAFGIFPKSDFEILLRALRRDQLLDIMAEPNLVTLSGHRANFLAGGQFPVPVPQGAGGVTNNVTIQFKDFGVQLDFLPFIIDNDTIRLTVTPEVSSIDPTLGTTLVQGGTPVPGLNTRRAATTVELQQGQTLAIAGLLQVQIEAQTDRIPGLGDLPYIGPLFSNTSHQRVEKELMIMVTPYLVKPLSQGQVACLPGANLGDPTDCEFYLKNRIEGRIGTGAVFDSNYPVKLQQMERGYVHGPVGFSE